MLFIKYLCQYFIGSNPDVTTCTCVSKKWYWNIPDSNGTMLEGAAYHHKGPSENPRHLDLQAKDAHCSCGSLADFTQVRKLLGELALKRQRILII